MNSISIQDTSISILVSNIHKGKVIAGSKNASFYACSFLPALFLLAR